MKKFAAAALCSVLAVSMTACSSNTTADDDNSGSAQTILIGIAPDYPPYESKDTNGTIEGFDPDMTAWIFNYLNENGNDYDYEFVELSFDQIISSLQAGQVDLGISGFTYDPDRSGIFSDSYYDSAQVIIVNADSDINSSADLNGKKVAAQQGTTGETAAKEIEGADVTAVSDAKAMMESLKADQIDAVVLDIAVAQQYAANGDYKILDEKLMDEQNVIYTTEDNQELLDKINEAIAAFKDSDDYTTLSTKWFGNTNE